MRTSIWKYQKGFATPQAPDPSCNPGTALVGFPQYSLLSFLGIQSTRHLRYRSLATCLSGIIHLCLSLQTLACIASLACAKGAKEIFHKAPKVIYSVILWYSFVVQFPSPQGENHHFMTVPPPPPPGGNRPHKRGEG